MAYYVEVHRSRLALRVSLLTLIAVGFAGCSSDVTRFDSNPFASNSTPASNEMTGSISRGPAAPVGRVESRPLRSQALPPPPHISPSQTGSAAGAPGMGSYRPPYAANQPSYPANQPSYPTHQPSYPASRPTDSSHEVTGSLPPASHPYRVASRRSSQNSQQQEVTVGAGDTLYGISRRYGISVAALMQANGIRSPNELRLGQRLVIPRDGAVRAAGPATRLAVPPPAEPPQAKPAPARIAAAAPAIGGFHITGPGDTLYKIARRYRVSVADLARANRLDPYAKLSLGTRLAIPAHVAAANVPPAPAPAARAEPAPQPKTAPVQKTAQVQKTQVQRAVASAADAHPPVQTANLASPSDNPVGAGKEESGSGSLFRWPVHGRIVAAFGAKPNGQQNDGINISVPEGTPIKAAESGEVAYAGNELKGYGNLILIRHPNGFVTAYAHASELLVKRGDKVKRGQVIAKSGQTGNINSPQLHFEIRKGSTPVDPSPYLGA